MRFTDKQLEQLKQDLTERTSMGDTYGDGYLSPDDIKGIIDRLEASEKIVRWACEAPQVFRNDEFSNMVHEWLGKK